MPKRSSTKKPSKDLNVNAFNIASSIADDVPEVKPKNAAAVALGRLGGLKGGKARAAKLSDKKRKEIAKKAAEARWGKKKD